MKILVDENIPLLTVNELTRNGHDVKDLRNTVFKGSMDSEILEMARRESRLLITTDKGFGQYHKFGNYGILIIRLRQPNCDKIHSRIMKALSRFTEEEWKGITVTMRDNTMTVFKVK